MLIGCWAVQDGLGIVLVRSFFRLAVWIRFFHPLGCLLGSFWGASGLVLGHLGLSWVRFGSSLALLGLFSVTPCNIFEFYNPIPSTHQLINPSTSPGPRPTQDRPKPGPTSFRIVFFRLEFSCRFLIALIPSTSSSVVLHSSRSMMIALPINSSTLLPMCSL